MRKFQRLLTSGLLLIFATGAVAALPDFVGGQAVPSLAPLVKEVAPAVVDRKSVV